MAKNNKDKSKKIMTLLNGKFQDWFWDRRARGGVGWGVVGEMKRKDREPPVNVIPER